MPVRPTLMLTFAVFVVAGTLGSARVQDRPKTDAQRAQYLADELRGADRTINRVYSELMQSLPAVDRDSLRTEQRAWLRTRDQACGLGSSQGSRESWLASLVNDYQKTVCVVRLTSERVATLAEYQRSGYGKAAASEPDPVYELSSSLPVTKGKFYFEVTVDEAQVLKFGETALFFGVAQAAKEPGAINEDGQSTGTLLNMRKVDTDLSKTVYGFALDLDNGRLYSRENGVWNGGEPGSAGGSAVTLGRRYIAHLSSTIALNRALKAGAVVFNVNAQPFAHPLPQGYQSLHH